jgi:hypothetical protein
VLPCDKMDRAVIVVNDPLAEAGRHCRGGSFQRRLHARRSAWVARLQRTYGGRAQAVDRRREAFAIVGPAQAAPRPAGKAAAEESRTCGPVLARHGGRAEFCMAHGTPALATHSLVGT